MAGEASAGTDREGHETRSRKYCAQAVRSAQQVHAPVELAVGHARGGDCSVMRARRGQRRGNVREQIQLKSAQTKGDAARTVLLNAQAQSELAFYLRTDDRLCGGRRQTSEKGRRWVSLCLRQCLWSGIEYVPSRSRSRAESERVEWTPWWAFRLSRPRPRETKRGDYPSRRSRRRRMPDRRHSRSR